MKNIINEIWRPIKGYENYEVSNLGRVKSLNYHRTDKEQIMKSYTTKKGYLRINLLKNGKGTKFLIHRLVAEAFIPNPDNKPCIDHINTVRDDNRVENLRWCTISENCNNFITKKKYSECRINDKNYSSKPVVQYNSDNLIIGLYSNAREAERQTGINNGVIRGVCNQLYGRKTASGYKWRDLYDQLADWLEEIQDKDMTKERVA